MDWRLLLGERLLQATPLKKIARLVCNTRTPAQLAPAGKESPPAQTKGRHENFSHTHTHTQGFPSVASPGKGVSGSWQASTPAQKDRKVTHTTGSSDPMVGSSRSFEPKLWKDSP